LPRAPGFLVVPDDLRRRKLARNASASFFWRASRVCSRVGGFDEFFILSVCRPSWTRSSLFMGRYASCSVAQFVVSRNDAAPRPVRTQKYVSRAAFGAFEAPAQPLQGGIAEAFQQGRDGDNSVVAAFFTPDP
jgi:hypothetical protein